MYFVMFYFTLFCLVADSVFGFSIPAKNNSDDFGHFKSENASLWTPFIASESGIEAVVSELANATNASNALHQSIEELCTDLVEKYKDVDRKDAYEECPFKVEVSPMNGNREVNVTLYAAANATFNEFMVQPRHSSDHKEMVPGHFIATVQSEAITCFKENHPNVLVQNSTDPKSYVNAIWKPQRNVAFLKIIFYATVYVDGDVIYDRIISEDITVTSNPGMHHS